MTEDLETDVDADGLGYGADGRWLARPCVVCDAETQLRCAGCRRPVCHNCICPDGCEAEPTLEAEP